MYKFVLAYIEVSPGFTKTKRQAYISLHEYINTNINKTQLEWLKQQNIKILNQIEYNLYNDCWSTKAWIEIDNDDLALTYKLRWGNV